MSFAGAKLILAHDGQVLTYQRDDHAHLPWPGHWDLPGGGREGEETPEACVLRELDEEFGLNLPSDRLIWRRAFPGLLDPAVPGWFFAGLLTGAEIAAIRFGSEGQGWRMMGLTEWLTHPRGVAALQARSRIAATDLGWL